MDRLWIIILMALLRKIRILTILLLAVTSFYFMTDTFNLMPKKCDSPSTPKTNIVFLKTHKCAGSTIQNILLRYGDFHNLSFALPKKGNYFGHPAPFKKEMLATPRPTTYNIFAHHARLDFKEIQSIMPKNTKYITILRDPIDVFESEYSYYNIHKLLGEFHYFLEKYPESYDRIRKLRSQRKFAHNQMLFDLGADPHILENCTLVLEYIEKLNNWFDLVLIADRMDESLILLKNLMCWDFDDVIAFKINERHPMFKKYLTRKEKGIIRQINKADVQLYYYFLRKFEKAIDEFGQERMFYELKELQERTQSWYDSCVRKQVLHPKIKNYYNAQVMVLIGKDNINNTCKAMMMEEIPYTNKIRMNQEIKLIEEQKLKLKKASANKYT